MKPITVYLILLCLLFGCGRQEPAALPPPQSPQTVVWETATTEQNAPVAQAPPPAPLASLSPEAAQAFARVVTDAQSFFTPEGEELLFSVWAADCPGMLSGGNPIQWFTLVDLEQDDSPELVLWLDRSKADIGILGYRILRYDGERVTLYDRPYRGFRDLKSDGTFHWSGGAYHNGTGRLTFPDGVLTEVDVHWMECSWDPELKLQYFVLGQPVTEEAYLSWTQTHSQGNKSSVTWVDYTPEALQAALTEE